jgi:hypothetical protein
LFVIRFMSLRSYSASQARTKDVRANCQGGLEMSFLFSFTGTDEGRPRQLRPCLLILHRFVERSMLCLVISHRSVERSTLCLVISHRSVERSTLCLVISHRFDERSTLCLIISHRFDERSTLSLHRLTHFVRTMSFF